MREIEFRAWDKKEQTMWFNVQNAYDMQYHGKDENSKGLDLQLKSGNFQSVLEDKNLIAMQWTGLVDKDGKKIFDSDILGGIYSNGTVEYCDVCKSFQYHAMGTCFACEGEVHWYELVAEDGKIEVVGNIYEHPERLEENL